MGSMENMYE